MKYQMVLWDFDGTLAYTGRDVWITLEHAAAKCGGRLPKEFTGRDISLSRNPPTAFENQGSRNDPFYHYHETAGSIGKDP